MNRLLAVFLAFGAARSPQSWPASAETFPDHVVKIVVPYPPGGPGDTTTRVTTRSFADKLGQSVIVENEPGAGGKMGGKSVARSAPDGYTLLSGGSNENAIMPALYKNLEYDPVKDLVPVAALATDSNAVVVNPSLPVKTLAELASYAKEHPGKLTSGSTLGISPHLLLEFLRRGPTPKSCMCPTRERRRRSPMCWAIRSRSTPAPSPCCCRSFRSGKLRALAVTSAERWPELPDVPTLHEAGFDGFPPALWFVLMAPAATPVDRIVKLNEAVNAGLRMPESACGNRKDRPGAACAQRAGNRRRHGQRGAAVGRGCARSRRAP